MRDQARKLREKGSRYMFETENIELLRAKDAMIKPAFVHADDSTDKIISKLKKEHINVCIVVEKDKTFVGEISVEDLIKLFLHQVKFEPVTKILNRGYRREIIYKSARQLVNKHKAAVNLDTPINQVIELIYKEGFRYIPVLDKDKVVGVVTPSSVLNLLKDY
ncbi:MAG: CBS domain-containing protein [Candidatus Woesearchaeota archaeon]